jgi:alpha-tubulin suppressor-like RCC1 family protein
MKLHPLARFALCTSALFACSTPTPPAPNDGAIVGNDVTMGADGSIVAADSAPLSDGAIVADDATSPGPDAGADASVDPCANGGCPAVTQLSLSQTYSCALLMNGQLRCWGANTAGQLGDGTTMGRTRPTLSLATGLVQVSTGYEHACGRRMDGTVWCWGHGTSGQLGNGAMVDSPTPVQVQGITNAIDVAAGQLASCALLADRTARCWGRGEDLGNNSLANSATPVTVMNLSDATDLSMGFTATRGSNSQTTCALRTNGAVRCWGYGMAGQIGNGARSSVRVPTDVTGISTARALNVGGSHVCVVLMDNTVRCWGDGISGQLGDGTQETRDAPVAVTGLANVRSLALGDRFSCAVTADGSAQCWGEGGRAQLGRGVIPPVGMNRFVTPAPVVVLRDIVLMAAGEEHACAFTRDGVTRCWGDNGEGQLGDGNATLLERFPTPLPVRW